MVTGKIIDTTGKIKNDTGKITLSEDFSGDASEITGKSEISRYRDQSGPDRKQRNFPLRTQEFATISRQAS